MKRLLQLNGEYVEWTGSEVGSGCIVVNLARGQEIINSCVVGG